MIRPGDTQIPYDNNERKPGSWRYHRPLRGPPEYPEDSRRGVTIVCACGREAVLRSMDKRADGTFGHAIDPDGTVSPSIVCPHQCGWHVMGRLLSWSPNGVAP
jgi:hypothetical protein